MFKFSSIIKALIASGLTALMATPAAAQEIGTKYIFNEKDYNENIEQYTLSKGEEDFFTCLILGVIFTKESMVGERDGTEIDIFNSDNFSPTVINVYKDKIEWTDLGEEAAIEDGSVKLLLGNVEITIEVIVEDEILYLGLKEDSIYCKFPFSMVK